MLQQGFLHFKWPYLFAAAIYRFLDAAPQEQVAFIVHEPRVTSTEPAIPEGFRIRFRIILIATENIWPPDDNFADFTKRQNLAVRALNTNFRAARLAYRTGLSLTGRQWVCRDQWSRFGHAKGLENRNAKQFFDVLHEFWVQCGGN